MGAARAITVEPFVAHIGPGRTESEADHRSGFSRHLILRTTSTDVTQADIPASDQAARSEPTLRSRGPMPRRWATLALGVVLAGVGASFALAGTVATTYAEDWSALDTPQTAAVAATSLEHARTLSYPMEQVWPTALRYLRVDRGYALVDRDTEAGYILFDFPVGRAGDREARAARGSVEMFATTDNAGRAGVRLQISTDAGPTHLPHAIAEGLAAKLRRERGNPVQPPATKPPSAPPGPSTRPEHDDHRPPMIEPPLQP